MGYGSRASTTTAPWISHTAETTPAPGTSATTALIRDDAGCMDRGFNSEDFTAGSPAPRNTSSTFRAECELFLEADLRDSIDEMADLGIDTIIVAYPEGEWLGWGSFYPDTVGYLDYDDRALQWIDDPIGVILEQADANGMHVYMGTGRGTCDSSMTAEQCAIGGPLPCLNGLMPTDAMYDHALSQSMSTAQDLWAQYGDLDSFYGWFISHESQLYYKDQPSDDHSCGEFFNELAADLHDEFGAEMPVMVAPSGYLPDLDATYIATSNVDVFAYQDAMGCNFDPVTDTLTGTSIPFVKCRWHPAYADAANWGSPPFPANGYSRLDHISDVYDDYAAIHAAAAGLGPFKHLWDDLEVWRKPGPDYASASFAGPCSEVSDQMAAVSDSVEQFTMYAYLGYMQSAASKLNPRPGGRELYDEYEDFATGVTGSFCP